MDRQPCVYILTSKRNGTLYTGVTSNVVQLIWQHRNGIIPGFTEKYGVKRLVWYELHSTMPQAISREKAIKNWRRSWKLRLIDEVNPGWRDLYPEII